MTGFDVKITEADIRAMIASLDAARRSILICIACGRWMTNHPTIGGAVLPHDCRPDEYTPLILERLGMDGPAPTPHAYYECPDGSCDDGTCHMNVSRKGGISYERCGRARDSVLHREDRR